MAETEAIPMEEQREVGGEETENGQGPSGMERDATPEAEALPPYQPVFDDSVEKVIVLETKTDKFNDFVGYQNRLLASVIPVGTIKFDVELERVQVDREEHKDLIVHVVCHRDGLDPKWSCTFQCEISADFGTAHGEATGLKTNARVKDNSLTMPIMRLPEDFEDAQITVKIKMTKWKGFYPRLIHDFTKKNKYTNATLIIEEQPLYVTRAIISIHSAYFNTLFNNEAFSDSAKTEYDLPDVSYDDMLLFLNLTYPETMVGKRQNFISRFDDIERILHLSEQFTVPSFKNLAEDLLKDAATNYPEITWTRLLYIADRYRLSETCSTQMRRLVRESDFIHLRNSEEFDLLSAALRSKLLNFALDKLPGTNNTRKVRVPSRTGRIDQFSDVEEDDDDMNDVQVLRSVHSNQPPRHFQQLHPTMPTVGLPLNHAFMRPPPTQAHVNQLQALFQAQLQAAQSAHLAANPVPSNPPPANPGNPAPPQQPVQPSLPSGSNSSGLGPQSAMTGSIRQIKPTAAEKDTQRREKDIQKIKFEMSSSDSSSDDEGDGNQPGPSTSSRPARAAKGVTTRGSAKRGRGKVNKKKM